MAEEPGRVQITVWFGVHPKRRTVYNGIACGIGWYVGNGEGLKLKDGFKTYLEAIAWAISPESDKE